MTADVEVRTPSGANVTVPVTTYLRLGLPEAAALDLPVPDGTQKGTTKPTDTPRFAPPYLDSAFAAGNARVGDFEPANRVQSQVEAALKNVDGFKDFLPNWNDRTRTAQRQGQGFADVAQQLANQRKLNLLSPTALKSNMDSLLGPGVNVQLKNSDATTNTYVNITVKAKLSGTTHSPGRRPQHPRRVVQRPEARQRHHHHEGLERRRRGQGGDPGQDRERDAHADPAVRRQVQPLVDVEEHRRPDGQLDVAQRRQPERPGVPGRRGVRGRDHHVHPAALLGAAGDPRPARSAGAAAARRGPHRGRVARPDRAEQPRDPARDQRQGERLGVGQLA
ncbi:hypothetical protein K7G98_22750 [Saccharothrix sp. MB29]|nr:hypothetical protein [Saccharothrix sp. MB29]